ncbi:MAG: hypothetical protein JW809_08385 [Pirellulales bacterium]|nr:hypothetical protein [Pirellulales bacterium]
MPVAPVGLPPFSTIEETVKRHFDTLPDVNSTDILARSDVEPLGALLRAAGWLPPDWKDIVGRVPADKSFLVRQFRAPAGRKFAAQIAPYPLAFDRVDRLSQLPDGRKTVLALIRGPDGYKMIEYMTASRGGKNLGKQVAHAPGGKAFNKPTGRIYTLDALLAALRTRHEEASNPKPKH